VNRDDLPIRTERLLLRRFAPTDVPAILELSADEDVREAASELGTNEAEAAAYVSAQQAVEPWAHDALFDLAIERVEDHSLIGMLTLVRRTEHGELGYALRSDARGRGLATEAAAALIAHAFGSLALTQVIIETAAANRAARGVAERLGGQLFARYDDHGTRSVRYHLERDDWRAVEATRSLRGRRSGRPRPQR
jgi:RimJ/RimL family protein N-acetyltransferase